MTNKTLRDEIEDFMKVNSQCGDEAHPKDIARFTVFWLVEAFGEDSAKIGIPLKERTAEEFKSFVMNHANKI
ncbi:MAG: hypothetical protein ACXABY_12095 [Candidatus Thorarchaeota archaeon]|jgi:hypothetical protein